jgi:signal transduction histidine kinase
MNRTSPAEVTEEERRRLLSYARQTDYAPVVVTLRSRRDLVLSRWLEAVRGQPFHLGRPERAVSDHIPALFDAVADALQSTTGDQLPLGDGATHKAAVGHAQTRVGQGLLPAEIVIEFRILREEILHALREEFRDDDSAENLLGAQIMIGATLDTAVAVAIDYFMNELERAKDDFLAIAAHDLRNPLTPLKGATQLIDRQLRGGTPDLARLARNAAVIGQAVERIEQLIDTLLDVTRVQTGRLEIRPEPVDLCATAERVIARQSEEARRRTLFVRPNEPLVGEWEPSRLEQVLENLLGNALKYAPDGLIRVMLRADGDHVVLEVRDDGIGLSPADRAQLFRRFYRSPEVIDRKLEGTGLGLYISRGIVEAHGGEMEIFSAGQGKGTTVTVSLPFRTSSRR